MDKNNQGINPENIEKKDLYDPEVMTSDETVINPLTNDSVVDLTENPKEYNKPSEQVSSKLNDNRDKSWETINKKEETIYNPVNRGVEVDPTVETKNTNDIVGHSFLEEDQKVESKKETVYEAPKTEVKFEDPKKVDSYNERVEKSASARKDPLLEDKPKVDLYSEDKTRRDYDRNKSKYHTNSNYLYDEHVGRDFYPKAFYAGFWKRFVAFILDSLIAGLISDILVDGAYAIGGFQTEDNIYKIATTAVFLLYFFIMTLATNGQTLGKMIMRLRVVRIDGEKLDFMTTLTREIAGRYIHSVGILSLLYVITAFTERKQNLSDMFADTSVIDLTKLEAYELGIEDNLGYKKTVVDSVA